MIRSSDELAGAPAAENGTRIRQNVITRNCGAR